MTLTAIAAGYRNGVKTFNLTVNRNNLNGLVWTGYTSSNIQYGENAPSLNPPTGAPGGVPITYRYTSRTMSICTVNNTTGVLSLVGHGTCTIRLTASADHYDDKIIDQNITIGIGTMSNLVWNGYSNNNTATFPTVVPTLEAPTGAPEGVTVTYTFIAGPVDVCTIMQSTGALVLLATGTCRVRLTVSADHYRDTTIRQSVTIN